MRVIFDTQDEQDILQQMSRNQNKAESISQNCAQQGKVKQATSWTASAQQIGIRTVLLEQVFRHKN